MKTSTYRSRMSPIATPPAEGAAVRLPRLAYRLASRVDSRSLVVLDLSAVSAAWLLAYIAGFEGSVPFSLGLRLIWVLGLPIAGQILVNRLAGLYGPVWRYASVEEAARVLAAIVGGALAAGVVLAALARITGTVLPLFTAPPVALLLMLLGCGGIRFQARLFALERQRVRSADRARALIVGAGSTGAALASELATGQVGSDVEVVGFVDDDPALQGRSVRGAAVLGTTEDLERLCREHAIDRVLIAQSRSSSAADKAVVERALRSSAQVMVLPPTAERVGGPLVRSVRDLDLADLLGREHAPVDGREISEYLAGATVLVTGAGGSIGSEIARQVARYQPARLLLLDRDESLLHDTLVGDLAGAEPVLADIADRARIDRLFEQERPGVVFHAAAHKHVPMLERHPAEAVRTNVIGTWRLAQAAARHGCRHFVHISTDKAADPCSVMGATKRAAEQVVFEVGRRHDLPFVAVRFGNVLGSRGSVVPTFLRQILAGGPVTVTSEEMTRFFMTIPEAVSLVLQSGSMADEGRIFLLDMGEPVSILRLARQMIRLAGLRPGEDVPITITGPRPGERLHERLHDDAEVIQPADHPSISALTPKVTWRWEELREVLRELEEHCAAARDHDVAVLLQDMLVHSGVRCRLEGAQGSTSDAASCITLDLTGPGPMLDLTDATAGGDRELELDLDLDLSGGRRRVVRRPPAILGGPPAFGGSLPFARPARPPMTSVMARLRPSYDRGQLTNGKLVRELEERVADRLGVPHVVAVSSCTSGLTLAVQALVQNRHGHVVVPGFTFSASGHAVAWNGRRPRFVDCDATTFQLDPDRAAEALDGAAALMATHVFGAPCQPKRLQEMANSAGVPLLFDAAHGFGGVAQGRPLGSFGSAEVFSLSPTKVLVAGEGGLVTTKDADLAAWVRLGRDYGNPGDYDTRFVGLNARMSEFHAAVALESLAMLDGSLQRRRQLASRYRRCLDNVPGIRYQSVPLGDESTFKDFSVVVDPDVYGLTRNQLVMVLAAEGIDTRNYFDPPLHRQRAYAHLEPPDLPVTEATSAAVLSLPIYPDLPGDAVERVVEAISRAHEHAEEIVGELWGWTSTRTGTR